MTDLSIVSGTYNRLAYLRRMVASARASLAAPGLHSLSYEIILVDGGSIDGTPEWIAEQPDCRLIKHPGLLGAIKAFNDGAYAATGDYVILANDDIEFIDDAIWLAWLYMQRHPDVGQGCFYQDRGGNQFHVDRSMPAIVDGVQRFLLYGQVCIVPRWLGDRVGWWGKAEEYQAKRLNPPRTYGGDNELSSQVYQLGYRVEAVEGARIHDNEAMDDLRKLNNITGREDPKAVKGHHPDSYAWGRKWRQESGLTGAIVRTSPTVDNPLKSKERVLYLPIFEQGWHGLQHEQKRGLRDALGKLGSVVEFDYVGRNAETGKPEMLAELQRTFDRLMPTIVLTQLHNGAIIDAPDIWRLRGRQPETLFVNWNGDYWPENTLSVDGIELARAFHLQTTVNLDTVEKYRDMGIQAAYWQIGWEPDGRGYPGSPDFRHDVVFLGNGYSPARRGFVRAIKDRFDLGLYGLGWPDGWASGQTLYNFREGCKIYQSCRISLGDSQWPDTGFVSNRIFQALAAGGTALAHQWFRGMEDMGLIDGQTCIVWRNLSELESKLNYYLAHERERRAIAEAGEALAVERHSFDARVQELMRMVGRVQQGAVATVEEWRW